MHSPPPAALGGRAEGLPEKTSALVHSLHMECRSTRDLEALLHTVQSFTTDMGTELGLADVPQYELGQWLPESMARNMDSLQPDGGLMDEPVGHKDSCAIGHDGFTFSEAIPWPGMMHILHNCAEQVHKKALEHWPTYLEELRAVCKLLTRRWNRERFVEKCLRRTPVGRAWISSFNEGDFRTVIEWCWGSLLHVLTWLIPLKPCLVMCWDARAFAGACSWQDFHEHGGDDDRTPKPAEERSDPIDLDKVTLALGSQYFWAYSSMLLDLQATVDRLGGWAESCPCHDTWLKKKARQKNVSCTSEHINKLFGKMVDNPLHPFCPLHGKRAPELANGAANQVLNTLFSKSESKFLAAVRASLTSDEMQRVAAEWSRARDHIMYVVASKLFFASRLPWKLCGTMHHDPIVAMMCAHQCLDQFDTSPEAGQHRKALQVLRKGSDMRCQFERFARGEKLEQLPDLARLLIPLKFVSTVERSIEQKHSLVSRALGKSKT